MQRVLLKIKTHSKKRRANSQPSHKSAYTGKASHKNQKEKHPKRAAVPRPRPTHRDRDCDAAKTETSLSSQDPRPELPKFRPQQLQWSQLKSPQEKIFALDSRATLMRPSQLLQLLLPRPLPALRRIWTQRSPNQTLAAACSHTSCTGPKTCNRPILPIALTWQHQV